MATQLQVTPTLALVSRPSQRSCDPDQYLLLRAGGAPQWTTDPVVATPFETMREATRAALRLPGALRAFSIPRGGELRGRLN